MEVTRSYSQREYWPGSVGPWHVEPVQRRTGIQDPGSAESCVGSVLCQFWMAGPGSCPPCPLIGQMTDTGVPAAHCLGTDSLAVSPSSRSEPPCTTVLQPPLLQNKDPIFLKKI